MDFSTNIETGLMPQSRNGTNGYHPAEVDIFQQLANLDDPDDSQIRMFTLENVEQLVELKRHEQSAFYEQLYQMGISKKWVKDELKPAISEVRREKARSDGQNVHEGVEYRKRPSTYRAALLNMGLEFRRNLLYETIEVNGNESDQFMESEIMSALGEIGLSNVRKSEDSMNVLANENAYNPMLEWFESLEWDGEDHMSKLFELIQDEHPPIIYDNGEQRSVSSVYLYRFLIGAVAKLYDSKKNQNPMLVLDGHQGLGKSFFIQWLCPKPEWHFEGNINPNDKDNIRYLSQVLIWEASELGGIVRKSDIEQLKAFLTKQDVKIRPAYARKDINKPTITSFIGTINSVDGFLSDPTGHRRFRPVTLTGIDWAYAKTVDREQLWAQAHYLYKQGERWQLTPEEQLAHSEISADYEHHDPMEDWIREFFIIEPGNLKIFTGTTKIIDKLRAANKVGNQNEKVLGRRIASVLVPFGLKQTRDSDESRTRGYRGIAIKPIHDPNDHLPPE